MKALIRRCLAPLLVLAFVAWFAIGLVPIPRALLAPPKPSLELTDRTGKPLRVLLADNNRFARKVPLQDIPQRFVDATLAAEDKRFWQHEGVDFSANIRAALNAITHRKIVSGASTITQQLVKIAERKRERGLRAKVVETVQALSLERKWTKTQILEAYLNRLDYGNSQIGCGTAAQFYFGKPLADLSIAETAFLAGLPQAPSRFNPYVHLVRSRKRQAIVLRRMRENAFIADDEFSRAISENLHLAQPRRVFEAPHFVDFILREKPDATGDLRTTLDLELTRAAEEFLRERIARLNEHHVQNGAVVVIDNHSGDVLALVGSENYFAPGAGQVNGAWSPRSAGSTFKPFTYLLAFERGATPASVVADLPAEFATATGIYRPENYNHRCYGPMRYRLALANSLNISAVKVLASIGGAGTLQECLRACGLTTLSRSAEEYGLGLTIGNAEARLLEMTNAYACLARLGEFRPFRVLQNSPTTAAQIFEPNAAFLIADILSDNDTRTLAFGPHSSLRFDFPVACKTGTSTDYRDNWALGFTPEFTVGVWVGNFDGTPMENVSGVTGAAPILHDVFTFLHDRYGTSWYATPPEIVEKIIHPVTGKLLANQAATGIREKFIAGDLPPREEQDDYDSAGRVRLRNEYRDWLASGANWLGARAVAEDNGALRVIAPVAGTTYLLDPDLPVSSQRIRLIATGAPQVKWQSDSLVIQNASDGVYAILTEGRHDIRVLNPATGQSASSSVSVKSL